MWPLRAGIAKKQKKNRVIKNMHEQDMQKPELLWQKNQMPELLEEKLEVKGKYWLEQGLSLSEKKIYIAI